MHLHITFALGSLLVHSHIKLWFVVLCTFIFPKVFYCQNGVNWSAHIDIKQADSTVDFSRVFPPRAFARLESHTNPPLSKTTRPSNPRKTLNPTRTTSPSGQEEKRGDIEAASRLQMFEAYASTPRSTIYRVLRLRSVSKHRIWVCNYTRAHVGFWTSKHYTISDRERKRHEIFRLWDVCFLRSHGELPLLIYIRCQCTPIQLPTTAMTSSVSGLQWVSWWVCMNAWNKGFYISCSRSINPCVVREFIQHQHVQWSPKVMMSNWEYMLVI